MPISHIKLLLFERCVGVLLCTQVCVYVFLCTHVPTEARRGVRSPGAGLAGSCELHGCYELDSSLLQQQEVLFTSELPLHPQQTRI